MIQGQQELFLDTWNKKKGDLEKMLEKEVYIQLEDGAVAPTYAHDTDAGMDICANEDVILAPGETKLIHTGIHMVIPEGYEVQIRPRSGLSLNTPLRVCNAPGTIDAGYRDEVCIIMQNTSERFYTDGIGKVKVMPNSEENHYDCSAKGNKKGWYEIKKGNRIAQMVLHEVPRMVLVACEDVTAIGTNRNGGFGSTGTK